MINYKFISFSAVQIYDLSYIHSSALSPAAVRERSPRSSRGGTNERASEIEPSDQLPDGTAPVSQRSWVRIPFWSEFFSGFNFTTAQVVCITAIINYKFISFSAVQIYDLSYIHLHKYVL